MSSSFFLEKCFSWFLFFWVPGRLRSARHGKGKV